MDISVGEYIKWALIVTESGMEMYFIFNENGIFVV